MAFLNWRFGLTQMTAWRIEVAPVPGLLSVATPPQKLSSPSQSLYMDMGVVMMPKRRVLRDVQWAGACLFSYPLEAEPDGYSDGLCRACAPHARAHHAVSRDLLLRHHHHSHIHIEVAMVMIAFVG